MALNKFIHFNTRAAFDAKLVNDGITDVTKADGNPYYNYTVFIKDTKEIYTHGAFYNGSEVPSFDEFITESELEAALSEVIYKNEADTAGVQYITHVANNNCSFLKQLPYQSLGSSTVQAGYRYYNNVSGRTVSTYSGFDLKNSDTIIMSRYKITFSGTCKKMEGLNDLEGSFFVYCLSYLPYGSTNGHVVINGAVYE